MIIEIGKFFIYAILIVLLSKILLAKSLRGIAENLKLKPRIVGGITGIATSIPEFLTVTVSSFKGLSSTSLYNIFSSNVINFIQYIVSILINKNYKEIKNRAIIIQLGIAIFTIVMPIFLLKYEKKINIYFAILFIIIYFLFSWIIKNIHDKYLKDYEEKIEEDQMIKEIKKEHNHKKTYVYFLLIIIAGILLYIIGNALGNVLEKLSEIFGIAESILGILLGIITSIPEFITFFESQKYYKRENERKILGVIEATNNLVVSNMLNLFIIQSIGIMINYINS